MILVFFVIRNTHQFVIPSINNSDMDHERNVSDDTIYIIIYNANLLYKKYVRVMNFIYYIYSLLSVRLEFPVADSIKQHHVYSVRIIKIFPYVII